MKANRKRILSAGFIFFIALGFVLSFVPIVHAAGRTNTLLASGHCLVSPTGAGLGPYSIARTTFGATCAGGTWANFNLFVIQFVVPYATTVSFSDNSANSSNVWKTDIEQQTSSATGSGSFGQPASFALGIAWCYCEFGADPTVTISLTFASQYVNSADITNLGMYITGEKYDTNFNTLFFSSHTGNTAGFFTSSPHFYPYYQAGNTITNVQAPNPSLVIIDNAIGYSVLATAGVSMTPTAYTLINSGTVEGLQLSNAGSTNEGCLYDGSTSNGDFCLHWGQGYVFNYNAGLASFTSSCAVLVPCTSSSVNPYNGMGVWVLVGSSFTAPNTGTTQTQTTGSCPPGGGTGIGHFALANSTQYWYSGNALGQEAVNTIQTEISSIKGSGSHTLQLLIYVTAANPNAQAPSVNYPAILAYSQSVVITSGTTNNTITFQVSIPLNTANVAPLPFNFWAVGIVGDDHIFIAGSSTSGLRTQAGAASTATQPNSFTSTGSSSTNKLALCATGQYQSVITGPTTTTTAAASTTTTATITSTVNTIGTNLFTQSSNWPVIFLILLLPAGLFLGVTKSMAGALLGLMVGMVLGVLMGILPSWIFVLMMVGTVAFAVIIRNNSGGG